MLTAKWYVDCDSDTVIFYPYNTLKLENSVKIFEKQYSFATLEVFQDHRNYHAIIKPVPKDLPRYIHPSFLYAFYRKKMWGIQSYYATLYGIEYKDKFITLRGKELHEKYGYNNTKHFFGLADVNGLIAMEGTPDHINPLVEFKTITSENHLEETLKAAEKQLLAYMYLLDVDYGKIVVMNMNTEKILVEEEVKRDDTKLFDAIREFFGYLRKQSTLGNFLE
ncbi:MAG: hypothetical protein QXS74_06295 [Nitrososphaeria archaeon]